MRRQVAHAAECALCALIAGFGVIVLAEGSFYPAEWSADHRRDLIACTFVILALAFVLGDRRAS